jgi:hypothetical protein
LAESSTDTDEPKFVRRPVRMFKTQSIRKPQESRRICQPQNGALQSDWLNVIRTGFDVIQIGQQLRFSRRKNAQRDFNRTGRLCDRNRIRDSKEAAERWSRTCDCLNPEKSLQGRAINLRIGSLCYLT